MDAYECSYMRAREMRMLDIETKLNELINRGNDVINQSCFGVDGYTYYSGDLYKQWISECEVFLDNFYPGQGIVRKFKQAGSRAVGNGSEYFNEMIGILKVLLRQNDIINPADADSRIEKIFISHSNEDNEYVGLFIQLLNNIGISKDKKNILCSSYEGYNIPSDEKSCDFIEKEFNKNIWVVFMLSNNYYSSVSCLNEMGAAWVTKKDYISVILPDFNIQQINGAMDATKNGFYITDSEKLNSIKDRIIEIFNLAPIDRDVWQRYLTRFLSGVKELEERDKNENTFIKINVKKVKKISKNYIQIELRLINDTNVPIEFTQAVLTLTDEDNNKFKFDLCDMEGINKLIYAQERRRLVFEVKLADTDYDPIKHKSFSSECRWVQGY